VKYTHSWEVESDQVDLDIELGKMVAPGTGIWTRIGTSFADSDRDASILFGVRFIR